MAKKALLIGINYPGTKAELQGCVNDVQRMYRSLVDRFDFAEEDIVVLIDTDDSYTQPTGANIRRAIEDLVASASPGDYLFLHFSGHGTRLPAETGEEDDTGFDECIVPCDMNLITDEDFKEFVEEVPDGCRLTIVSDSCHSGGLLKDSKEQIGDSTKRHREAEGSGSGSGSRSRSGTGLRSFLKESVTEAVTEAFESRGIHLPVEGHHHHRRHEDDVEVRAEYHGHGHIKNKSLPLSTLIEILKQKTGKDDIDVGKIRPTLFDMFGEDASPKVKRFMKVIFDKLSRHGESGHGFMSLVSNLAQEFLKNKLEENDEDYVKPVLDTEVSPEEAYAGTNKRDLPDNGILISGCQTDETSADANPPDGKPYGALSNAIQTILEQSRHEVTNKDLVSKARDLLAKQGFTQRPGLYCTDEHVHVPFVC